MNSLEARLYAVEKALRDAQETIRQLTSRLGLVEQNPYQSAGAPGGGGGGGGALVLGLSGFPTGAATFSGGNVVPGGNSAVDIYKASGGLFVPSGTSTVSNPMPSTIDAGLLMILEVATDGSYVVTGVACNSF